MDYTFTINDFEGPLDLLLHLVRSSKMDIYTISIKTLIDEYLEFLDKMDKNNIDVTSSYLTLASELIHLKSRMLVNESLEEEPENDPEYEINTEDDLRRRLLEYERIKNMRSVFKELENKRSEIYEKLPSSVKEYAEEVDYSNMGDVDDLYNALLRALERKKLSKPLNTRITKKELSIEDRCKDIRNILKKKGKVNFLDLFDIVTKEYIVVTFLSILDMSKNREINIIQKDNFSPIVIERM